ncbi:DUF2017 family protein [Arcanobacterium haemolyticum]|nr:DUF2017 family protein [Arcanobacterium haemolyticum]
MWTFRPERGGYVSNADTTERHVIRGLARDVCTMLGMDIDHARAEGASAPSPDPLEAYANELADLAAYDEAYESVEDGAEIRFEEPDEREPSIPMDEAYLRLLPDMSEEPELARDLRDMTQENVALAKVDNLVTFYRTLEGDNDTVWVTNEAAPGWLAACNDIRIVLAARLDIVDDATSQRVYDQATTMMSGSDEDDTVQIEETEDLLAVLYTMLSWWQESLLRAISNKALRK